MVCIVEIKRNTESHADSISQIIDYMLRASSHPHRARNMLGFLIAGSVVTIFKLQEQDDPVTCITVGHISLYELLTRASHGSPTLRYHIRIKKHVEAKLTIGQVKVK